MRRNTTMNAKTHLPGRNLLRWLMFIALVSVLNVLGASVGQQENSISLAGAWRFQFDPENVGVEKDGLRSPTARADRISDQPISPASRPTGRRGPRRA